MDRRWKLVLGSRPACIVVAICMLGICVFAVCYNIYNRAGGEIESISECISCFTMNEIQILGMGVILFIVFMIAARNADIFKKKHLNEDSWYGWEDEEQAKVDFSETSADTYVLNQGKFSIAFSVPAKYIWDKTEEAKVYEESDFVLFPYFQSRDGATIVHCSYHLEDVLEEEYSGAEEYVQDNYDCLSAKEQKETGIKQAVIEGKYIVHYFVKRVRDGFDKYQSLYAVCEIEKGKIFELEMIHMSWEKPLGVEDFEGFFQFNAIC